MWVDAISAQSEGLLESMQWTEDHPELAAHALVLAMRGTASRDPDKDRITRRVIDVLEFAPAEVLAQLAEGLLATYPLQKHDAAKLLDDITDLLPPALWPELSRWTMSYADESAEWRSTGQHYAPAGHWFWALPEAPPDSPIWTTLQPEMLKIARISNCWYRSETRGLLERWFTRAPISLAREVGETMIAVPETEPETCVARTKLLILLEEQRQELRGVFTKRLLASARSAGELLLLARHLALPDVPQREEAVRELVANLISEAIKRAAPTAEVTELRINTPRGVELVKAWRTEDKPLLEELVAGINSPSVHAIYLPWLLGTVQLLVANGPVEFANFVRPHVASWIHRPPSGSSILDMHSGPFSTFPFGGAEPGYIAYCIGWITFQLHQKLGPAAHSELLAWAKAMLLAGYAQPLELVVYAGVVVSLSSPAKSANEGLSLAENALLSLWTKATDEPNAAESLAAALRYLASFFAAEGFEFADWNSQRARSGLERNIRLFERFLPRLPSPRTVFCAALLQSCSVNSLDDNPCHQR
jgi:hypothetical protein